MLQEDEPKAGLLSPSMPDAPLPEKPSLFANITTGPQVAEFLRVSWESLRFCLYRMPCHLRYRIFETAKKGGGVRIINAPCERIKYLQTCLLDRLYRAYQPRACAHAYSPGRNIVSNARGHVGSSILLNIDLKDFFPSIHIGRIIGLFKARPFGAGGEAAATLARLCTWETCLPQGAPTSPILSNMVCFKMDKELTALAKAHRCLYTRYADDITFSTRLTNLPMEILQSYDPRPVVIGANLQAIIQASQFTINETKVRVNYRSQRMVVTGLKVNRFPNVSRRLFSQIRAMLHAWRKHGLDNAEREFNLKWDKKSRNPEAMPAFRFVLLGKLLFVGQVRGFSDKRFSEFARQLYELDGNLLPKAPGYAVSQVARPSSCVLTDDEGLETGTGFFLRGVGLVTCHHVAKYATKAFYPDAPDQFGKVVRVCSDEDADLAICKTTLSPRYELEPNYNNLRDGAGVFLYGFPKYNEKFSGAFQKGYIVGRRSIHSCTRYIVSCRIVAGNSGGPMFDSSGRVTGVALTGDVDYEKGYQSEDYGVIPLRYLMNLFTFLGIPAGEVPPGLK